MVFPQTPLDVRIDLQINGIWTDVTADTYTEGKIVITRGRADEGVRADPGKCTLTFNNRLGKYSPRNPLSPYYQLIGRNTPLRVSVRAGSPFLALSGDVADFASTPDTAVLDITGDLDLRWEGEADWYADGAQSLIGKWEPTGNQKAYLLRLEDRNLIIHHATDGATGYSFGRLLPALPRRAALRATLDVDNGAGGKTARFYWARSIAGPWIEFADPVTIANTIATFVSTAPLTVAPADTAAAIPRYPAAGRTYKAEVRSGIGGTVVANPDFAAQAVGTTSFADGAGRTWSMNGAAAITNRRVRFIGEVSAWPSRWDVSGKDIRVPVEAQGILRRLGQGQQALQSTLRRRIPSGLPLAYWPLEDGRAATQFYSPIPGVRPLRTQGFDLAADDSLAGSSALPVVQEGATLSGSVPIVPGASVAWHTEFIFNMPNATSATARTVLQWNTTGTVKRWRLMLRVGVSEIYGYDDDDNVVTSSLVNLANLGVFDAWSRWQLYAVQNGGNVDWTVRWIPIGGSGGQVTTSYAGIVGRPIGFTGPTGGYHSDLNGLRLGHIAAFSTANTTIYNSADLGFAGETAGVRMMRLREEEGVPLVINGVAGNMEQVGAQRPATFLALLEEAAGVDGGILGERREDIALAYRDRISLYNQPVTLALDYLTDGHVAPPLEPVDDDQKVRNDVTVTREGGSSERAVLETGPLSVQAPPGGVGVYDEAVTLNLYADEQAEPHAFWRLHLGTVDEARYPVLNVNLAAAPSLIDAVTDVDSGDRMQIAHPPAHLPPGPIDLLAQGYQEVIGHPIDWDLQFNCTPARPWTIGEVEDPALAWADADGSELASAATTTATTLDVLTTVGAVWRPDPAETPFDLIIGGEEVRVSAGGRLVNPNPWFEVDTSGWIASNGTIARSTAVLHPQGVASLLITPNGSSAGGGVDLTPRTPVGSIIPGASYIASAWVYSPGGWSDLRPCIDWYDAANVYISTGGLSGTWPVPAGTWTFLQQTLTAPANASRAAVRARHGDTPAAGNIWYVWGLRITQPKASWLHDAFGRTASNGWGVSDAGLTWNTVGGGAAADYSVGSGYGVQVLATVDVSRRTAVTAVHADFDLYCDVTTSALATGDSLFGGPTARMLDASNMYQARLDFTTGNTIVLSIRKILAGANTAVGSTYTLPAAHVAGTFIRVRFQGAGTTFRARAWLASSPEPTAWHIEGTDNSLTAAAQIGTRSIRVTGNTNAATLEIRYRAVDVVNPQLVTVERSLNDVVKAQTAGTDVRLAYPPTVAL